MFIGVYACISGFVFLLSLLALARRFQPVETGRDVGVSMVRFSALSIALSGLGLAAFIVLSMWAGILRFGQTGDFRIAQDYIEYGFWGWMILAVGLLGSFMPIAAALWTGSRR